MSLQRRWADVLGDESVRPDNERELYTILAVAAAILQRDALLFLMQHPLFARWLCNTHDVESVWLAVQQTAMADPNMDDWHGVVGDMPLLQRAELSALRPYSHNAAHYYRQHCDERADEIDCNDLFHKSMSVDKVRILQSHLQGTPIKLPQHERRDIGTAPLRLERRDAIPA